MNRSFKDKLRDYEAKPADWEPISTHGEKASRKGSRRQGASTQTVYRNATTGETIVRHILTDDTGRVIEDHFRPHYNPRRGDRDDDQ